MRLCHLSDSLNLLHVRHKLIAIVLWLFLVIETIASSLLIVSSSCKHLWICGEIQRLKISPVLFLVQNLFLNCITLHISKLPANMSKCPSIFWPLCQIYLLCSWGPRLNCMWVAFYKSHNHDHEKGLFPNMHFPLFNASLNSEGGLQGGKLINFKIITIKQHNAK